MKKFNLSKGLIVGLLTLALCFACFGAIKASAGTHNITFNVGSGSGFVTGTASNATTNASGEYTLPTSAASGWKVPENIVFDGWKMNDKAVSGKISVSGDTTLTAQWKVKDAALESAKYDPDTDSIVITTKYKAGAAYLVSLKQDGAASLKANAFKNSFSTTLISAMSGDVKTLNGVQTSVSGAFNVSVPLSGKSSKFKIAESKDGYIVVSMTKPAGKDPVSYTPNLKIAKTDIKKLVVNFNYVSAMSGGDALAISSIVVTPTEGDAYTSVSGDAKWAGLINRLQYSTDDGKNWYPVNAETANSAEITAGSAESTLLNSNKLYKLTQAKKATKMSFRLVGTESPAMRTSKAFKVSVKTAGKAEKALKINAATNSIVIKNGYDFFVTSNSAEVPSAANFAKWQTILPVAKDITGSEFKNTIDFVPFKKPDETVADSKNMFTSTKVKEVAIDKFCSFFEGVSASSGDIYVYIRKSAGVGKPAASWNSTAFVIKQQIEAPTATISDSAEPTLIAKSGSKNEMKGTFSGSGSSLEVLVVGKSTDLTKIDWSKTKWAKYNSSKGIIFEKTSTKVTVGDSSDKVALGTDTYVLVRYAGDKKTGKLASPYIKTAIESSVSGSETTYKWVTVE